MIKAQDTGHYNSMHNKSVYEVEYPDGTTEQLTGKIIAENMLSQVYSEVHHYQLFTKVTDHKRYDIDITKLNGFIKSSNGSLHRNRTTRGWKLLA